MILADFIDKIHPQIILIQFCGNDYANNLYDLDLLYYPLNNHAVRPYLENDHIVYRLPLPFAMLRSRSFIADRVLAIYDRLAWNWVTKDLNAYLEKKRLERLKASQIEKEKLEGLKMDAVAVTKRIYLMIKKMVGGLPVYIFNYNDDPVVEDICRVNNFKCILGDLLEEAILIVYNKIESYDLGYCDKQGNPHPVRFVSYIWKRIDGFIIDYLREEMKSRFV